MKLKNSIIGTSAVAGVALLGTTVSPASAAYGGTIESEADTNSTFNTDETWVFLSGGWGEVRLGDEDGVADNSSVGAQVIVAGIAAGTAGIDGSDAVSSRSARSASKARTR